MITKEKLIEYAEKLMFRMSDEEYDTLIEEFEVIEKQMELISKIEGIEKVEPMIFPYNIYHSKLRKDEVKESLNAKEAFSNAKSTLNNQIIVPKVVE